MIRTERLTLERPNTRDIDDVLRIHGPETYEHKPELAMRSRDEAKELVRSWQQHWDEDGIGYFTVRHEDAVIGFTGVRRIDENGRSALNLYYRYAPAAQGKGYAREAAEAAIAAARASHSQLPIIARIAPQNTASIALARRLGMVQTDRDGDDLVFTFTGNSTQHP